MKILMVTNTFTPHVGGVTRSVEAFSSQSHALGHRVAVICPQFEGTASTGMMLRVPAIEHFLHTDFSFPLPIPSGARRLIDQFASEIVHSHHPFFLGNTAVRVGTERGIPVVFIQHTQNDKHSFVVGHVGRIAQEKNIPLLADAFASAIGWIDNLDEGNRAIMKRELAETATQYSIERSAQRMLELYERVIKLKRVSQPSELNACRASVSRAQGESNLWGNDADAFRDAVASTVRGKVFG